VLLLDTMLGLIEDEDMTKESGERYDPTRWWFESAPWKKWHATGLTGLKGSSKAYLLSRWRERFGGPLLVIVPDLDAAELLVEDLGFFQGNRKDTFLLFPPWETLPYDEIPPHPEIARERVSCLFALDTEEDVVIVASVKALMQRVLLPAHLKGSMLPLVVGEEVDRGRLVDFLDRGGYTGVRVVEERGDFSLRGAIVDIFSPLYEDPLRLEFDGDRLESIRRFDIGTQRSSQNGLMGRVILLPASDIPRNASDPARATLFEYLDRDSPLFVVAGGTVEKEAEAYAVVIQEHYERTLRKKGYVSPPESTFLSLEDLTRYLGKFPAIYLEEGPLLPPHCRHMIPFSMEGNNDLQREMKVTLSTEVPHPEETPFAVLSQKLQEWSEKGMGTFIASHTSRQAERLGDLLSHYRVNYSLELEKGFRAISEEPRRGVTLFVGGISSGFRNPLEGWILLTEEEIFGERRRLRPGRSRKSLALSTYSELRENDFIVHLDFGVGRYRGLKHLKIGLTSNDYLLLEYLDGDKLYIPVDRLNLIQRYVGGDGKGPKLDKLGSQSWERTKKKVKAALTEMVKELLDLYATRRVFKGHSFSPGDQWYRAFEATFEYEETPDQVKAIDEVNRDMVEPTPMDRLICGDVGYGKTEVAIRAAYRAVMDGKQVAVLVPTTVLAQQHHQTFLERFRNYPVIIEVLSRFRSPGEQKRIIQKLHQGKVDIVIGTHRLLQGDVVFRDLGLVVVDEEHRFGVRHKERLKQMKRLVDVITLTATPIPRTLQMAVSGIRDLTLIQTPPQDRLSIRTFVVRYEDDLIREAIARELDRGGQVFFVHPRVQNIQAVADHLRRLVPRASLAVAHGQMRERELEKVMLQFVRNEFNVLVCTSIIESGLDIPSANTILINHAERFGLADLYQLRGRVGRGRHQAYAYLLIPTELVLSKDAMRRLRAIQELSELGSGFKLALQDLEIRGAGNLLGPTQSGHIHAVGFELYTQLMERAVKELKGEDVIEEITPEIQVHLPSFIPEGYVEDPAERLNLYRRLSLSRADEDVDAIRGELIDRFGRIPVEVANLLEVIRLKIFLTRLSISKFEMAPSQVAITFHERTTISPQRVVELVRRGEGRYRLTPESKLIVEGADDVKRDPWGTARKLLHGLS
jgi:transcription-repair coupling factor (superfamily II helicase)